MSYCPVCNKERGQINKCEVCEYDFQKPKMTQKELSGVNHSLKDTTIK